MGHAENDGRRLNQTWTKLALLGAFACVALVLLLLTGRAPESARAAPVLDVTDKTSPVLLLDANKPETEGPDVLTIHAEVCNRGDEDLCGVSAYVGTYNDVTPGDSIRGYFPPNGLNQLELLDERLHGDTSDATRYLGRLIGDPVGDEGCRSVYWQVWYSRTAQLEDQTLDYGIWADGCECDQPCGPPPYPYEASVSGQITYRDHLTANENKISPNPGGSLTISPSGVVTQGEQITVCFSGVKLGNSQHPADDIWHQPIGDSTTWDPDLFTLVAITSSLTSNKCPGAVYEYEDQPFLHHITSGDWDGVPPAEACIAKPQSVSGDYCYVFVAIGSDGYSTLAPYQESGSGNQFKYNDDFGAITVTVRTSDKCSIDLVKSVDKTDFQPGDTLRYTVVYENVTGNAVGQSVAGLVISDTIPVSTTYVLTTLACPSGSSARYSVDGGQSYWSTEPSSQPPNVTHVQCVFHEAVGGGDSGTLSYAVTVDTHNPPTVVHAGHAASNFGGGEECSRSGDVETTPVTLAYFEATARGRNVHFEWSTATEVGNAGFNLFVQGEAGLHQVNRELIPSNVVSSIEPQEYAYDAAGVDGTAFYLEEVSVKGETRLHGPFEVSKGHGARPEVERIDWASIGAEHRALAAGRAAKRGRSVDPTAQVALLEVAAQVELLADASPVELLADASPVELLVKRDGLYRVTYEQLQAAGFELAGVLSADLALTNRGVPAPIRVEAGNQFGPGAFIEFYGEALDTLYTQINVYALHADANLARRVLVDKAKPPQGAQPPANYMETATVDRNLKYDFMALGGDPWYDTMMLVRTAPMTWSFDLAVDNYVAGAAAASLTVDLKGHSEWPLDPDHHLVVGFNGRALADDWFDGVTAHPVSVGLPEGLLREGANTVQLTLPGDSGARWDMVFLSEYGVTYARAFQAREGGLTFTAAGDVFAVQGLPSADVVVYRVDGGVARLTTVTVSGSPGAYSAVFVGSSTPATYLVYSSAATLTPGLRAARPATDITSGTAGYLIISHPDFIEGLGPLLNARQALDPRVVNVEDIYAQFGHGVFDAQAIRDYVGHAVEHMGTQYVLLVGGDTYDYRNYLGQGSISFIPSLYAATDDYAKFSPVDPLYTDVNGDNVPDRPIGRLPVRTRAELDLMVAKTLAYQDKAYGRTVIVSADDGFAGDSESFVARVPDGWTVQRAYLDELGVSGARSRLISAINDGVALASYVGHSGPTSWTFDGLFSANDAASLTNYGRPTVVTQWGCWNTYYVAPSYNTLAHKFLVAGQQGAAAVLGSTTISYDSSERALGELLMPRLVEPGMTIGAALQEAKAELSASHPGLADVLLGWTILGDPALVIDR